MSKTVPSTDEPKKFSSQPRFRPFYTPAEALFLGVYGGKFFYHNDSRKGVPPEVFKGLPDSKYKLADYDPEQNYWPVDVPLKTRAHDIPLDIRQADRFGWFQWYTKYYYGMPTPNATPHRVNQWIAEIKSLWFYIENDVYNGPTNRYIDISWNVHVRQQLLQFCWDPTKKPTDYGVY
jgi:hypothetical protein